jgi:hypothetical protein
MKKIFLKSFFITCLCAGCTITRLGEPIKLNLPKDVPYKYYVIDVNSDTPDAFFESYSEASIYQKEFSENHEYVIVKVDDEYKVYNMVDMKSK